ncbi:ATP-dependent helicase [Geothrix limicola]|uniref:DNA 3'-5' helicase n=1 Tax=Geothrix limicola TaxID=2927978 RepID=A0ABQ5QJN0_9BACT|nr:ATP-dependent helicase [Geothrix limicola]GLH74903.1 ATP-dependent helicase [Geothrix limicola]
MGARLKLTQDQQSAVSHPTHLSLVSCPGSGKTRTLIAKIVEILPEVTSSTRLVGCITYTNAAVNEIESRLSGLGFREGYSCEVETIHSFCLKHILVPYAWHIKAFSNGFEILACDDQRFEGIVTHILKKYKLPGRARGQFENLYRGSGQLPEDISEEAAKEYWAVLDKNNLVDLNGIIYWSARLVLKIGHIARGLASRYQWLLVDEFQDTTVMQVEILRAINRYKRTKFFIVGDPFQSIMSGFGARPDLMNEFGAEVSARTDIELLENFRSSEKILKLADKLCPRSERMKASGEYAGFSRRPEWYAVPDMSFGILNIFLPAVQEHGISLSQVGILANRWTSHPPLARALRENKTPVIGPGARPYRRGSSLIAKLLEEVSACALSPTIGSFSTVRREVSTLLRELPVSRQSDLGFQGDVTVVRILRHAKAIAGSKKSAIEFIAEFTTHLAETLIESELILETDICKLKAASDQMITEIQNHERSHGSRGTTVQDLGLFARGSEAVRLLTMHSSKGREFEAVALIDVFDGHVPFYKCKPGDEIEAEGRRLLYVAITRAKKLLMLFTLKNPDIRTKPSRFLKEIFPAGPSIR